MPRSEMPQLNMRVPGEVLDLLVQLQDHLDRSRPWVVGEALRVLAQREGLAPPPRPRRSRKNPKKTSEGH